MTKYNEESIKILEGLEAVRKRPGMYIGSTDKRGLHHLVWEIVDNSIDEVINGFGKKIRISINKDGSITVEDEGRGVPVGGASAIAGERGQEAVVPLTDSQQMDLLGQAIARHMVINNFVDNYIDGRKLNRILQSSNDRTRF